MRDGLTREWLEADGLGGFASGTVAGHPHAALSRAAAHRDDAADRSHRAGQRLRGLGRHAGGRRSRCQLAALRARRRAPRRRRAASSASTPEPWPRWTFRARRRHARRAGDLRRARRRRRSSSALAARRRRRRRRRRDAARAAVPLRARLPRAASRERPPSASTPSGARAACRWRPYRRRARRRAAVSNGRYAHEPDWYRNFLYDEERARGLDCVEDLASPGDFSLRPRGAARPCWLLRPTAPRRRPRSAAGAAPRRSRALRAAERRAARRVRVAAGTAPPTPISCAAAPAGRSSPAIRGSPTGAATPSSRCAASASRPAGSTTRATSCSSGPARSPRACCRTASPTAASAPEFNSVDASLWFVVAVHEFLAPRRRRPTASRRDERRGSAGRGRGDPRRLRRAARASASARTPTACSPPASPACSSPGWTPRSATGS